LDSEPKKQAQLYESDRSHPIKMNAIIISIKNSVYNLS